MFHYNNNDNYIDGFITDNLNNYHYNDIDVHPPTSENIDGVINLRLQHSRDNSRPTTTELSRLNIRLKFDVDGEDDMVDEMFILAVNNLKLSKFSNIFEMKTIVLVNLEDYLIFRHWEPIDFPECSFIIGFVGDTSQYHFMERSFYERFPSYNVLRERNAVQIVTHDGKRQNATIALLRETYEKLDRQLEASIKIVSIATDNGVLKDCSVTNKRGRLLQFVAPEKLAASGGGVNIGSCLY